MIPRQLVEEQMSGKEKHTMNNGVYVIKGDLQDVPSPIKVKKMIQNTRALSCQTAPSRHVHSWHHNCSAPLHWHRLILCPTSHPTVAHEESP